MKDKKGFISMILVYSILIAFLVVVSSLLVLYNSKIINNSFFKDKTETKILTQNTLKEVVLRTNIVESYRLTSSFNSVFTENGSGKLYTETVGGNVIYYFAGTENKTNPINNWVHFAGFYWRIIRIDGDGSIRLLYHGSSVSSSTSYIGETCYSTSTCDNNDPLYAGYMYGTTGSLSNNRSNTNDSYVKEQLEAWYLENLNDYSDLISTTAVYCNDRSGASNTEFFGEYNTSGTGFVYAAGERLGFYSYDLQQLGNAQGASYDCANSDDSFTAINDENIGNNSLSYPIGLITADEISFIGMRFMNNETLSNKHWYYYNSNFQSSVGSNAWWTMSPAYFDSDGVQVFTVGGSSDNGKLKSDLVSTSNVIRPVISLKSYVSVKSGDGSYGNPYEI